MYIFHFDNISAIYAELRIKKEFSQVIQLYQYVLFESFYSFLKNCPWRIKIPLINVRQLPRPFSLKNVHCYIDGD